MSAELTGAIERVYAVFANETAPKGLVASSCKDGAAIFRMIMSAPLRELSADALGPFATSALTTIGTPGDYLHFLPRILECAATGGTWTGYEPAVIADRLERCAWRRWRAERQDAVTAVFAAAFDVLRESDYPPAEPWLCGLAMIGEPAIERLVGWIETDSVDGMLQLADWRAGTLESGEWGGHPLGGFWEDVAEELRAPILSLLLGPRLTERLLKVAVPQTERHRIDRAISAMGSGQARH